MHGAAGNQSFVSQSILHIREQLNNPTLELTGAIGTGLSTSDDPNAKVFEDKKRKRLLIS
jgi:hypothetical protein